MPDNFELYPARVGDMQERLRWWPTPTLSWLVRRPVSAEVIQAAPRLKHIQKWASASRRSTSRRPPARHSGDHNSGANSVPVAEHTMLLIWHVPPAVVHGQGCARRPLAEGQGRGRVYAYLLSGKTVGLVGLGNIGQQVAKRLRGFDAR